MSNELNPQKLRKASAGVGKGVGKTHAVTTKLDAELHAEFTRARLAAGMTDSGFIRMALHSYLDSVVHRSIANEISNAAALVATAAESVSQPAVIARLDSFETRVQEQLNGFMEVMKGLLGEPVDSDAEAGTESLTQGEQA
jgi:hypothetical protein